MVELVEIQRVNNSSIPKDFYEEIISFRACRTSLQIFVRNPN